MIENYAKICDVIERLKKRKELSIAYGLFSPNIDTFSESDIISFCHSSAPSGANYNFVCSSFNCPTVYPM